MLNKITITQTVDNGDGGLLVSVQTNDTDADVGPHRFTVQIDQKTYDALPTGAAKKAALKGLVKAGVMQQHAAWLARKGVEDTKRKDVDVLFGDSNITP